MNNLGEANRSDKSYFKDIFTKYTLIFMEFSLLGWLYEVTLAFIYGYGFVNRGFLFGPFLPIYGFGGLLLYLCLRGLMSKKIKLGPVPITGLLVFFGIIFITTATELLGGLIIRHLNVLPLWDYSGYSFNLWGIIAPNPSIRFGLGGILMLYVLLPFFNKLTHRIPQKKKTVLALVLFIMIVTDFIFTMTKGA